MTGAAALVVIAAAGCATSQGAHAVVPVPSKPVLAEQPPGDALYDLSPARIHVRRLAPQALRLLAPHWSRVRESDRKALQATLVETLSETRVSPFVRARLAKAVAEHPDLAAQALDWLRSPVGYEVKFAEATAWSGNAKPEETFYASVAEVRENRTPEIRKQRIDRLVDATDSLQRTLDLTESVGSVVARLVNVARPNADPLPLAKLDREIERERRSPAVVEAYRPVVTAALLLRCRDLDVQELDSYIAWSNTDAGRWYHQTMSKALVESIDEAAMDVEGVFDVNAHGGAAASASASGFDLDNLEVPLPSGRSVRLLALAQTGPQNQPAVVLRYETSLPMHDGAVVSGEAREVWEKLRGQIESEGAYAAVLQPTGSVDGWVFPFASSRKFAWKRGDDGEWIALQAPNRSFGSVEREMLWSVPP